MIISLANRLNLKFLIFVGVLLTNSKRIYTINKKHYLKLFHKKSNFSILYVVIKRVILIIRV